LDKVLAFVALTGRREDGKTERRKTEDGKTDRGTGDAARSRGDVEWDRKGYHR